MREKYRVLRESIEEIKRVLYGKMGGKSLGGLVGSVGILRMQRCLKTSCCPHPEQAMLLDVALAAKRKIMPIMTTSALSQDRSRGLVSGKETGAVQDDYLSRWLYKGQKWVLGEIAILGSSIENFNKSFIILNILSGVQKFSLVKNGYTPFFKGELFLGEYSYG